MNNPGYNYLNWLDEKKSFLDGDALNRYSGKEVWEIATGTLIEHEDLEVLKKVAERICGVTVGMA